MAEKRKIAVLLPITSNGKENSILSSLEQLATMFRSPRKPQIEIFLGIDKGDKVLDRVHDPAREVFERNGCSVVSSMRFEPSTPPNICGMWRELAKDAYERGCDYFILLGDDVVIDAADWTDRVDDAFSTLHTKFPQLPFGFGCVALNDESAPGFPTFPVLHRLHIDIFGQMLPNNFINQDGDPFLFQLYKRWGASTFLESVTSM